MSSSTSSSSGADRRLRRSQALFAVSFAAGCLAILIASGPLLRGVFDRPNWKTMAVASLESVPPRVVFFGSSTIYHGIDPRQYDDPVVSFGGSYMSFAAMRDLWRAHAGKLSNARIAMIELNLSSLYYDTRELALKDLIDLGLDPKPSLADFASSFDGSVHRLLWPLFTWRLTPLFFEEYRFRMGDPEEPLDAVPGFIPSSWTMPFGEEYARREIAKASQHLAAAGERHLARNLAAARDLIASLAAAGVEARLIRMPLAASLRRLYPAEWEAAQIDAARQLGLPLVDMVDLQGADDESHFRDPDHLNAAGAALLAESLKPLLRSR